MNTQLQHLFALLVAAGLTVFFGWTHTDALPWLTIHQPLLAALVSVLLTYLASWAAPFMTAFGTNRKVVPADAA